MTISREHPFPKSAAPPSIPPPALTRISMDSAERVINVQLEYAKGALKQATLNATAAAGARTCRSCSRCAPASPRTRSRT